MSTPATGSRQVSSIKFFNIVFIGIVVTLFVTLGLPDRRVRAFIDGPPASHTNAPGEANCTICHTSFEVNSGPGSVQITGLPETYSPGQQVPVTVTVNQVDAVSYGFQLTALDQSGREAGTLVVTDPDNTQLVSGDIEGNLRRYIEHTRDGTIPVEFDRRQWTFTWVAPSSSVGAITFYDAGNGANGDQVPTGDHIYTSSVTILPSVSSDFTITAQPSSQTVIPGGSASYTVTVTPTNGFTGTVDLSVNGLPSDTSASFDPPSVIITDASPQSSTMTVTTSASTPTGTQTLIITGTSGSLVRTTSVTFVAASAMTANLSVSKVDSEDPVVVGSTLTYTITVTNGGPAAATGVVLTDTPPSGVVFNSVETSQGTCSGTSSLTCDLGGITNGGSATVIIVVTPQAPGQLTNTASVSGNELDPDMSNNTASETTDVVESQTPVVLDANLDVRTVVTGLTEPTTMAFLAANDFLVLEKSTGRVRRVLDGSLLPDPVIDLAVNFGSERGLLGIALHPDFSTNNLVYLYWTGRGTSAEPSGLLGADSNNLAELGSIWFNPTPLLTNRVDRFVWNGETLTFDRNLIRLRSYQADPGQPLRGNHNGGVIRFGPDGKLYIIVGDLGRRGQMQNLPSGPTPTGSGETIPDDQFGGPEPDNAHLSGVILRLNDDGTTPSDNPFFTVGGSIGGEYGTNIQKLYGYGIRNSFGMAFDPLSGNLWEQENGDDSFDEINRVEAGFNGGWMQVAGPIDRIAQFKQIETSAAFFGLQQIRWPPTNLADTPDEALSRLFMLPGSLYTDPEFSWKFAVSPAGIGFLNSNALGAEYMGDLFVGEARTFLANGYLFRFKLTDDRRNIAPTDPLLADRVADNTAKYDITESSSLLFGRSFGVATDIQTGPNGNLFVVSLSNGAIYEIFRR
ncbi:MAG: PQQ-dependent sugar dehydrogenase [Acidobacteriota bacterium]|nr:PQQ-dependent sugar dehydrogenase [Acidobacteriota bacterium]